MSYMRGEHYVYVSGKGTERDPERINIGAHTMPLATFDELVVMRVAELVTRGELAAVAQRAVETYSGNGGCAELCKLQGHADWVDELDALLAQHPDR